MKRMKKGKSPLCCLLALLLAIGIFTVPVFAEDFENDYVLTGDGLTDIIGVAYTQVGYYEGENGYTKYGDDYGFPTMDWCGAFIVWCAKQAGVSTEVIPKDGSSNSLKNYFESRGQYRDASVSPPLPGDIAFFSYTYSVYNISHVGLVTAVDGDTVYLVEGNYANHVESTQYTIGDGRLVGFASPDYGSNTSGYKTGRYVTGYSLNLRVSPTEYSTRLLTMPKGATIYVTAVQGAWGKVVYNGTEGWCHLGYCTFKPVEIREDQWLVADISKWNDPARFHWDRFLSDNVRGVIIRIGGRGYAGEREIYDDDRFYEFYRAAKAAGLNVGVYFFSYALNEPEAVEEADYVIRKLAEYNCELDMPVFIDIEDFAEGTTFDYQHARAGKAACTAVVNAFCDRIKAAGYYPGVYCNKYYAETMIDESAFKNRCFWIAQYGVSQCGYDGDYDLWQYTPYGQCAGYDGYIDLSYCYVDYPAIITGKPTVLQDPTPTPVDNGEHKAPADWTVTVEPTCRSLGVREKRCVDCGELLASESMPTTEHIAQKKTAVRLLDRQIDAGDVLTADYEAKLREPDEVSLLACRQSGGTVLTYCAVCKTVLEADYYYTDLHPGQEHNVATDVDAAATCTKPGLVTDYCTVCRNILKTTMTAPLGHTPGATKTADDGASCAESHLTTVFCSRCGEACGSALSAGTGHRYDRIETVTPATFFTEGLRKKTCTVCGEVTESTVPKLVLGDVDGDRAVNSNDARLVLRASVNLENIAGDAFTCADTDGSGRIDSIDARNTLRIAVGLETSDALLKQFYGG